MLLWSILFLLTEARREREYLILIISYLIPHSVFAPSLCVLSYVMSVAFYLMELRFSHDLTLYE